MEVLNPATIPTFREFTFVWTRFWIDIDRLSGNQG